MSNEMTNTPESSESELREMTVDQLRKKARDTGIEGTSSKRKDELVDALFSAARGEADQGANGGTDSGDGGAGRAGDRGPEAGRVRTGDQTSTSLKYSQEVTSLDDEPERAGRSLATTSHEVIRRWAEERDGVPATVAGTEHGDFLGVLRFDFGGDSENLRHVGWDEWFATFDARTLNFLYQEERKDGRQSTFFRLDGPDREDA